MRKFLSITVILFSIILTTTAFAALNIYEKPDAKSKKVAVIKEREQLIPFFYTEKKDWVKVANPQNGDVGWVKASELKGPVIITQVNGSKVQQIVTSDKREGKKPVLYSIIQYSGPEKLTPKDAQKAIKEMKEHQRKMRKSMLEMQKQMQKSMDKMFRDFDKSFMLSP